MGLLDIIDIKGINAQKLIYLTASALNQTQLPISDLLQEDFYLGREGIESTYDEIRTSAETIIQLKKNPVYRGYAYNGLIERLTMADMCLDVFLIRLAKGDVYVNTILANSYKERVKKEVAGITNLENPDAKEVLLHRKDAYQGVGRLNDIINSTLLGRLCLYKTRALKNSIFLSHKSI